MPDDTPAVAPEYPSFEIISKQIQPAERGPDGRRRFHLTASSTIEDRAGDEITLQALQKAAKAFNDGITIFIDHKFKQTDYAYGLTDKAEVIQRGMDEKTGKPIYDLDVYGVVNTHNPRAVRLADAIDDGMVKLGASITAFVRKHARKPNGGMRIDEIEPLEASVVGIAENQRSWAHKASLAVKNFGGVLPSDEEDEDEMDDLTLSGTGSATNTITISKGVLDASARDDLDADEFACPEKRKYPINDAAHVRAALSRIADPSNDQCGRDKIIAAARKMGIGEHAQKSLSDDELVSWALTEFPTDRITLDSSGQEVILLQKEIEVPEAASAEDDDEDDDAEGGQASASAEGAEETPETAPADADSAETDEEAEVSKSLDGVPEAQVAELLTKVSGLVQKMADLQTENDRLKGEIADLRQKAEVADQVDAAAAAISKALQIPLRSKAAGYVEEAARQPVFAGMPEVQEYLNKRSKISG